MQDPSLRRSRRAGCAALIGQEAYQILKAAAEPINAPGHNHIELALCCVSAERIEGPGACPALWRR
jgi:hypothetical protein